MKSKEGRTHAPTLSSTLWARRAHIQKNIHLKTSRDPDATLSASQRMWLLASVVICIVFHAVRLKFQILTWHDDRLCKQNNPQQSSIWTKSKQIYIACHYHCYNKLSIYNREEVEYTKTYCFYYIHIPTIEKHKRAVFWLWNKAYYWAHPPFALGRDVHFSHSILQHVNICPRSKLHGAGLVTPTASCLRIHVCRLHLFFTGPSFSLITGHIPAGSSVAYIQLSL